MEEDQQLSHVSGAAVIGGGEVGGAVSLHAVAAGAGLGIPGFDQIAHPVAGPGCMNLATPARQPLARLGRHPFFRIHCGYRHVSRHLVVQGQGKVSQARRQEVQEIGQQEQG